MNTNDLQLTGLFFSLALGHWTLAFCICALGVLAIALANREVRMTFLETAQCAGSENANACAMKRRRLMMVYTLGAVILGGSIYAFVTDTERWPFSQYPMYSGLTPTDGRFAILRLYGVTQRQPLIEFPLDRNAYLEPFDNSRIQNALDRARSEHRLTEALQDCLQRYDALRVSGIHHGPALQALRLYQVTWTVRPQANNVDSPDGRELLGEVSETEAREQ